MNDPAFVIDDNKVTDFFTGTAHTSSDAIRRAEERRIVKDEILDYINHIKTAAIEEFAHELKETFNQEFPLNYPSTKPFFTLDNVRMLVDEQVKNCNKCGKLL